MRPKLGMITSKKQGLSRQYLYTISVHSSYSCF